MVKGLYENSCENGKGKILGPHSWALGTRKPELLVGHFAVSHFEQSASLTTEFHILVTTDTFFSICNVHQKHGHPFLTIISSFNTQGKQSLVMVKNLQIYVAFM